MERTDVLELMARLKLYGMRAAYDEVMAYPDNADQIAKIRTEAKRRFLKAGIPN